MDLLGPLHADIFFCERLLLNSVDLRIKLIRSNDAFCLMGTRASEFTLKITAASLSTPIPRTCPENTDYL